MLWVCVCIVFFFFFKQKTAYEMRISDWSSDVCSSDLREGRDEFATGFAGEQVGGHLRFEIARLDDVHIDAAPRPFARQRLAHMPHRRLGRAIDRGRGTALVSGDRADDEDPADRKSTRLNSSHSCASRMPSSACKNK